MNISKFTDLVEIISGGTPNTHIKEYWSGNISWLSIADFKNVNKYVLKTEKKITSLGLEQSSTKILNKNSIIISARGTVGALAMLAMPMTFNQSCLGLTTKNNSVIINEYIYYYLKNYIKILKYKKEGSVFGTIDTSTFENINLKYPNTKIQYQITSTLSVIDSLIDNNNNIYSELEKMAKTLYDYWFVQFDFPDENGRPYKSSGGKMVWSEELQREIPYGWEVKNINNILSNRQVKSITPDANTLYKYYSLPSVAKSKSYELEYGKNILSSKYIVDNDCVLINKLNPLDSRVVYVPNEANQICSTEFIVLKQTNHFIKGFIYSILSSDHFQLYCKQRISGAIHKRVSPRLVYDYKFPYNNSLVNNFGKIILNLLEKKTDLIKQNQELTSLRDFLLPLLMNGQAVIKE